MCDDTKSVHKLPTLFFAGASSPQSPEGGDAFIQYLLLLDGIVIEVQALALVPEVFVDDLLPILCASEPFFALLKALLRALPVRVRIGCDGWREWRKWKIFFQCQFIVEHLPNGGSNVHFILVQQCLQIDRAEVCATLLESISGVVS